MNRSLESCDRHLSRQGRVAALFAALVLLSGAFSIDRALLADGPKAVKVVAEPAGSGHAEKEQAALEFASAHHSELADLLKNLKRSNRGAYDKGVHQLYRDSERLARTRANNPARYDLEIELWKTESRIRLTAARTIMDESRESLKKELRQLIAHREEVKLRILKFSRERTSAQLSKIESEIALAETGREARIDKELESLLKSPRKRDLKAVAKKAESKEADKPEPKKSEPDKTAKPEAREPSKPSEKTEKPNAVDRNESASEQKKT